MTRFCSLVRSPTSVGICPVISAVSQAFSCSKYRTDVMRLVNVLKNQGQVTSSLIQNLVDEFLLMFRNKW